MRALCVEDEAILLQILKQSVEESPDISEAACFSNGKDAIEYARENLIDIAFLDIQIHKMTGLELAETLRKIYPGLPVVFCTGYDSYALDAFKIHASGYILKPIGPEDIQEQIDSIKAIRGDWKKAARKLKVQCFGNFEVYADGKPLRFKRSKAKELLAYLINRKGATVSLAQIAATLWEDSADVKAQKNYLYQILHHLKSVLRDAGFEDLIISSTSGCSVNLELLDCDYYRYLDNDPAAQKLFQGEYMYQYSWAEETGSKLTMNL